VATPEPVAVVKTELGAEPAKAEVKLGADGKPIEEPKLDAEGKPIEPAKIEAPAAFDGTKLKLPEGMKSDDPLFKTFGEVMTDDKISPQDRGQKLLDLYTGAIKQAGEANTLAWSKVNEGWIKDVKADPSIGGANFEPTKRAIAATIDTLGPEKAAAFRQALDVTGIGNHPAFWRGMATFAKALTEGGHVAGSPAGSGKADAKAADFFPNSKMS
jgi:hypothetical protein